MISLFAQVCEYSTTGAAAAAAATATATTTTTQL